MPVSVRLGTLNCPRKMASLEDCVGYGFTGKDASRLMKNIPKMRFYGSLLLDVGAGGGESSVPYAQAGISVVSLDINRETLSQGVTSGNITRGMAVVGDGKRLPFRKGVFDVVSSRWFLHQFKGARQFLLEMKRVVKTSGEVVCVDFCALTDTMKHLWNTCLSPSEHILTKEELLSLWLSLGLRIHEKKWYTRMREQRAEELRPCLSNMKRQELQELRNVFAMKREPDVIRLVIPVAFLRAHIESPSRE